MKTLVVSTLALAAMTSVALAGAPAANKPTAGPTKLTAAQMDQVSAGQLFYFETNTAVSFVGGSSACGSRCGSTGVKVLFVD